MKQIFSIVPGTQGPFLILGGVSLLLVALIGLLLYIAGSSRNTKFELSGEGLRIRGDIYSRTIPVHELRIDEAKIIDLERDLDYRLGWSFNGSRMPGYSAGWFRLGNGSKALVFITIKHQVVFIPTKNGYSLMMSVSLPKQFLHALQQTAAMG